MSNRKNIYLPAHILASLQGHGSLSGRITTVLDRYHEMVRRTRIERKFTAGEISLMRDACNGWLPEPAAALFGGVALEVEDAAGDGLAEKWGVDAKSLLKKLEALTPGEEVALVDLIRPAGEE